MDTYLADAGIHEYIMSGRYRYPWIHVWQDTVIHGYIDLYQLLQLTANSIYNFPKICQINRDNDSCMVYD